MLKNRSLLPKVEVLLPRGDKTSICCVKLLQSVQNFYLTLTTIFIYYKAQTMHETRFDSQGLILIGFYKKNMFENTLMACEIPSFRANAIKISFLFLKTSLNKNLVLWQNFSFQIYCQHVSQHQ